MDLPKDIGPDESGVMEWASLPNLRVLLVAAGVCNKWEFANIAAEWAAQGDLATRAAMLFIDGKLERTAPIPTLAWRYALDECGIDWRDSALKCTGIFKPQGERLNVRARGIEVSLADLRNLLPFDEEDFVAEMQERYLTLTSDARRPSPATQGPPAGARTGDPGRPELGASLYEAELERRAAAGTMETVLADEARELLRWFKAEHPQRQPPTEKTIQNRIRTRHRLLGPK
jgi:hypothetical protein